MLPAGHAHSKNAWTAGHPLIKHSRAGKWRAAVLITVHLLIAVHIVQWLITGLTVSPVEPSESMYTLRDGTVNAGFVFFALAIVSTFVFGRFFCGWGCHIVAVQDLCGWAMMKLGIKPRPFRSRLLLLVPLGLAIYMFVWPVVVRDVVRPMLADERGRLPDWLGQIDPLPGYRAAFLVQDFWATFASWWVAIPFIFVCGVVAVYFLGAKGFCTYGCPYGGVFTPVDKVSIGRIVVNDDCEHCGHCTAVCTSNVRVSEEVRDYGMVVDPGCMKCMDCVSVCPNDALSFAFAKPAAFVGVRAGAQATAARAREMREARWDLSWGEEFVCVALFLALFVCYRGMFNQVPMLMAVGMAGLGAWACWKTWRLFVDASSRVHGFQLKYHGRVRAWGVVFALATLAGLVVAGWSGYVRWNLLRAQLAYQKLDTPTEFVLRPDFAPAPEEIAKARDALAHYRNGAAPGEMGPGGIAYLWPLRPDEWLNIGYLRLLVGDWEGAEEASRRVLATGHPRDALVFELARVMDARSLREIERMHYQGIPEFETAKLRAATDERIRAMLAEALAKHDDLFGVRDHLIRRRLQEAGTPAPGVDTARRVAEAEAGAAAEWTQTLARHPRSIGGPLVAAGFFRDIGDAAKARSLVDRALAQHDVAPDQMLTAAGVLASIGDIDRAARLAAQAADAGKRLAGPRAGAARLLAQMGRLDDAAAQAAKAVELARKRPRSGEDAATLIGAGLLGIDLDLRAEAAVRAMSPEQLAARAKEMGIDAEHAPGTVADAIVAAERARRNFDGLALVHEASGVYAGSGWELQPIGMQLLQMGSAARRADLMTEAVSILERARTAEPKSPSLRHDLAIAYYTAGRNEEAIKELRAGAELAPASAYLAQRLAELLDQSGKVQEAAFWFGEAKRRGEAPAPASGPSASPPGKP